MRRQIPSIIVITRIGSAICRNGQFLQNSISLGIMKHIKYQNISFRAREADLFIFKKQAAQQECHFPCLRIT